MASDKSHLLAIRSGVIDKHHAVLGRALICATNFEAVARSLGAILSRQLPKSFSERVLPLDSRRDVNKLVQAIKRLKLNTVLQNILKSVGSHAELADTIDRARVARNSIAHDIGVGLDRALGTESERAHFLKTITPSVERIALAHIILGQLLLALMDEELRSIEELNNNRVQAISWVLRL
jgi:hypothetical protein